MLTPLLIVWFAGMLFVLAKVAIHVGNGDSPPAVYRALSFAEGRAFCVILWMIMASLWFLSMPMAIWGHRLSPRMNEYDGEEELDDDGDGV